MRPQSYISILRVIIWFLDDPFNKLFFFFFNETASLYLLYNDFCQWVTIRIQVQWYRKSGYRYNHRYFVNGLSQYSSFSITRETAQLLQPSSYGETSFSSFALSKSLWVQIIWVALSYRANGGRSIGKAFCCRLPMDQKRRQIVQFDHISKAFKVA